MDLGKTNCWLVLINSTDSCQTKQTIWKAFTLEKQKRKWFVWWEDWATSRLNYNKYLVFTIMRKKSSRQFKENADKKRIIRIIQIHYIHNIHLLGLRNYYEITQFYCHSPKEARVTWPPISAQWCSHNKILQNLLILVFSRFAFQIK